MTNLPFALKFPAVLRTISWKTLLVCIAGVLLACTIAYAELPVAVPETTAAELARIREGNISWVAFRVLELAIPLLFLFTGLGARPAPSMRIDFRPPLVLDSHVLACAYLVLAALIALPFDFYAGYVRAQPAFKNPRMCRGHSLRGGLQDRASEQVEIHEE